MASIVTLKYLKDLWLFQNAYHRQSQRIQSHLFAQSRRTSSAYKPPSLPPQHHSDVRFYPFISLQAMHGGCPPLLSMSLEMPPFLSPSSLMSSAMALGSEGGK